MADFDPDAPQQPVQETVSQQNVQANTIQSENLYNIDPSIKKTIDDNVPSGQWWQLFFQSETSDIFRRMLDSILCFKGNFIEKIQQENKPDLWYPVWLCLTMVFLAFLCGLATSLTSDSDKNTSAADLGILAGVIIGYTFAIPGIIAGIAFCLDMENVSYLSLTDLTAYSQTILIPAMAFYLVVQVLVANDILKYIDISIFSICALWSFIFVTAQGIKYIRGFKGTKGQISGILITQIVLHAAYLITLGCLMFIV